jgi:Na+:H+ antiporter, NhaA family
VAEANTPNPSNLNSYPPNAWLRNGVQRIFAPVERFLAVEAASGIVLMFAAIVALVWANSPWRIAYANLWHIPIGFRFGAFAFERDLFHRGFEDSVERPAAADVAVQ